MNATQSRPAGRTLRPSAFVAFGTAALAISLVAIVALGGAGGHPSPDGPGGPGGNAGVVVPPPSANPSAKPSDAPSPVPASPATPKPAAEPSTAPAKPRPTAKPTSKPAVDQSDGGVDAMPIRVDLDNETGADVHVDIVDRTGSIVGAETGSPREGASVESGTVEVVNLDPRTLKLTWTDYPIDNALALYVDRVEDGLWLILVQPDPTGPTDAIAFDRELVLRFAQPISADAVKTFIQSGLDT
jgi:hypothetical protein